MIGTPKIVGNNHPQIELIILLATIKAVIVAIKAVIILFILMLIALT